jgi:hypothetical protein
VRIAQDGPRPSHPEFRYGHYLIFFASAHAYRIAARLSWIKAVTDRCRGVCEVRPAARTKAMKMKLRIDQRGACLHEGDYDSKDAKSFGTACADAWNALQARRLDRTTSIGDLMDALGDSELEARDGAELSLHKR